MTQVAKITDKYLLYQQSVQVADNEVEFFDRAFKEKYGRSPKLLREDFCGTHAICCEWVKSSPDRTALGIDLDPEPLAWGKQHNQAPLTDDQKSRITLIEDDVRITGQEKADVIGAENFSYMIFKDRDSLRNYFQKAYENLADQGILVCDIMGGSEVLDDDHVDERLFALQQDSGDFEETELDEDEEDEHDFSKFNGFMYLWEQAQFCPITHDATYHIHFHFPDGREMNKAFTYQWRLWTIPEIRELMLEAGFKNVDVYWEGEDEDGDASGEYDIQTTAKPDPAWIAYIVASK